MYQNERLNEIIRILQENGYTTVKYLTDKLHYSTATINRDLNILEKQNLLKRSYGGAEIENPKSIPLPFRTHKMNAEKNRIGKIAADLIEDGDVIFIGGSTTCRRIAPHITERKDLTVITNDMGMTSFLSEYGVKVICLGGEVFEIPDILCGNITVENAMIYSANKFFFSTGAISDKGEIKGGDIYHAMYKVMARNSEKNFYLADHEKLNVPNMPINYFNVSEMAYVITDFNFSDEFKKKYPNTVFLKA